MDQLRHITYNNVTVTVICTKIDAPNHRTPYLISQTLQNDSCDFLKELRDNFSDEFEFFIFKTSSRCNKTLLPKASHTGQSKQNLSAGRSELFIGGYQASAEYYQNRRTTDEKSYSWLWWICRVIFTICYVCTKFVKHTYIKICYIPGNLLNRHFAYHFMYLNNAETTCLQIRNEIIKIKTDDPTRSHGNYEVKLRPVYALHGKTSENAVLWQTQIDLY